MKDFLRYALTFFILFGGIFATYYVATHFNFSPEAKAKDARNKTESLEKSVLADMTKLRNLNLDESLFSLPAYRVLVDRTPVLVSPGTGISEPFALPKNEVENKSKTLKK